MRNVTPINQPVMTKINENRTDTLDLLYPRIMGLKREDYLFSANDVNVRYDQEDGFQFNAKDLGWKATDYAVNQVSDRLSKGLRSFGQELSTRHLNELRAGIINDMLHLEDKEKNFQFRTMQPNGQRLIRAVTSDKFKNIDDNLLIQPMCDLIGDHSKQWRSLGGQITDTHTRIRFISREPQIRNIGPNNRNWYVGFQYKNSEVGASSAGFSIFVFDDFCENGHVFGSKNLIDANFVHRGSTITSDFGLISEERIQQQELLMIRDSITEATQKIIGTDFSDNSRKLVEANEARKLEGNKIEQIKQIGSYAGLSKAENEQVLAHWDSNEENLLGVSSAITRLAQDKPDYESRVRLENAGGKLLEMPDNRWKSILALAN
jgi:hypothetical protein